MKMNRTISAYMGMKRCARILICVLFAINLQIGFAEPYTPTPCPSAGTVVSDAANKAATKEQDRIIKDKQDYDLLVSNAMNCLQKIKQLLAWMSVPAFPDLTLPTMEAIINWLSNRACQVVINKVQAVTDPFKQIDATIQNEINGAGGVIKNVIPPAYAPAPVSAPTVAPAPPISNSTWNRVTCAVTGAC